MEGFGNFLEGIKSAFSNIASSIGSFFSGGSGGGGFGGLFGGGATSSPVYTPSPTVGTPLPPAGATPGFAPQPSYGPQIPSAGITYPQDQTNIHRNTSVQRQGLDIIGQGIQQGADRIGGLGGRIASTLGAGVIAVTGASMVQQSQIAAAQEREARFNSQGAQSMAPHGQPMGPMPNARGQFGAVAPPVPLSVRLQENQIRGSREMMGRVVDNAQTQVAQELVNRFLPKVDGPGGFFFGGRRR